jgi:hypothetical protein
MEQTHCPQTGKIYVIIIFCLIFTSLLTSVNVLSKEYNTDVNDTLFGGGIAVNIIQSIYTLYLIGKDLFGECKGFGKGSGSEQGCGPNCKWYNIAPPNFYKCTSTNLVNAYAYIPIILLSSIYLLTFGIMMVMELNDPNDEKEITTLSIASVIIGAIGILYIFSDIICYIGCSC